MMARQAPVAPPRARTTPKTPMTPAQLNRVSKTVPMSPFGGEEKEEDERSVMFNRLQQFYLKWEPDRVGAGIGHIVDWTMQNGEEALNTRLFEKYGENLMMFEKQQVAEEDSAAAAGGLGRYGHPAESFMSIRSDGSMGSIGSQGPTIRDRLMAFYKKYDPARLQKGVDDLVDYVARKGLPALDKKLQAKYGVTLGDFENGIEREAPPEKPKESRLSMRSFLRKSFRAASANVTPPGKLPAHVRPLLEMYYSKYDQSKITSGSVGAIYRWAEKNGVKALNSQLKAKYLEDLDEFADRMSKLREDLVEFYTVHDPSKIESNGVDRILRWGVRNGRAAINKQLRSKYKCDLEQKDPAAYIDVEPDF